MYLGIMSTLTIMTQILTNYEKAGNHVTAVDIWLFVCLIMVFLALMEYALAYTISHYYDNDDDYYDQNFDEQRSTLSRFGETKLSISNSLMSMNQYFQQHPNEINSNKTTDFSKENRVVKGTKRNFI